jgi:hypothetical protein
MTEPANLESLLLAVWRQALVEKARSVAVEGDTFPVRSTQKRGLKQVDFRFGDREIRGLEQNPSTDSRWAAMARAGQKVMQFLERGQYIAVVADGKLYLYRRDESQ